MLGSAVTSEIGRSRRPLMSRLSLSLPLTSDVNFSYDTSVRKHRRDVMPFAAAVAVRQRATPGAAEACP